MVGAFRQQTLPLGGDERFVENSVMITHAALTPEAQGVGGVEWATFPVDGACGQ
jgi:hypothetical protein